MIRHSNLLVSAWHNDQLVGIARSVTDFHYACYLSDLAVSVEYQKSGIGKRLQALTQEQLGPRCKLVLIAAPAANRYYEHIGFTHNPRCWVLEPESRVRG
jgi:ribosomal protein S18 acetylase RimI-like enzyme